MKRTSLRLIKNGASKCANLPKESRFNEKINLVEKNDCCDNDIVNESLVESSLEIGGEKNKKKGTDGVRKNKTVGRNKKIKTNVSERDKIENIQLENIKSKKNKEENIKIQFENVESKEENIKIRSEFKSSKSEKLEVLDEKTHSKANMKKNARIKVEYENNKQKIEPPKDWMKIFENIKKMRSGKDAPVDTMGCSKCHESTVSPQTRRYQTLISLMLSSQTKDAVTFAAMQRLKSHGLTVENILRTSEEKIRELIYPVSFYKRKSEYILKTTKILSEKFTSDIPDSIEGLCSLPGVGEKMAYLCLDTAWNKLEGIGVDVHVHRITNRLKWTGPQGTKTPAATRLALESWLPKENWREMNLLLVGFGQQICLPVRPKCSECLNKNICPFNKVK